MKKIILVFVLLLTYSLAQEAQVQILPQKRLNFSSSQAKEQDKRIAIVKKRQSKIDRKKNDLQREEKKASLLCDSEEDFKAGKCKILTASIQKNSKAPKKSNTIVKGRK